MASRSNFSFARPSDSSPQPSPFSPPSASGGSLFGVSSPQSQTPFSPDTPGNRSLFAGATPAPKSTTQASIGGLFGANGRPAAQLPPAFPGFGATANAPPQGGNKLPRLGGGQGVFGGPAAASTRSKNGGARFLSPADDDEEDDTLIYEDDSRGEPTPQDEEYEDEQEEEDTGMFGDDEGFDDTTQEDLDTTPRPNRKMGYEEGIGGPVKEPGTLVLRTEELMQELYTMITPQPQYDDDDDDDIDDDIDDDMDMDQAVPPSLEAQQQYLTKYSKLFVAALAEHIPKSRKSENENLYNAYYITSLVLPLHHSNTNTTEVLRKWMYIHHPNPTPQALKGFKVFHPNYALCTDLWDMVQKLTLRGEVLEVIDIFRNAQWDLLSVDAPPVTKPAFGASPNARTNDKRYTHEEISAIKSAIQACIRVLQQCPGKGRSSYQPPSQLFPPANPAFDSPGTPADWRIWRGAVTKASEELKGTPEADLFSDDETDDSYYAMPGRSNGFGFGMPSARTKSTAARLPSEISKLLRMMYDILRGDCDAILAAAEDWWEAVVALMMWAREVNNVSDDEEHEDTLDDPILLLRRKDRELLRLQTIVEEVVTGEHPMDTTSSLDLAAAGAMASDPSAVLTELASHSLLSAAAVLEIAGYATWLPRERPTPSIPGLDADDLAILQHPPATSSEGADDLLRQYASALFGTPIIDAKNNIEGWELGVGVLTRVADGTALAQSLLPLLPPSQKLLEHVTEHQFPPEIRERIARNYASTLPETSIGDRLRYLSQAGARELIHDIVQRLIRDRTMDVDPTLTDMLAAPPADVEHDVLRFELSGYAALREWVLRRDVAALVAVVVAAGEQIDGGVWDREWGCAVEPAVLEGLWGEVEGVVGQLDEGMVVSVMKVLGDWEDAVDGGRSKGRWGALRRRLAERVAACWVGC